MTPPAPLSALAPPVRAEPSQRKRYARIGVTLDWAAAWLFLLVLGVHSGALLILFSPSSSMTVSPEAPRVQGIIIPAVPQQTPQELAPPAEPTLAEPVSVTPVKRPPPAKPKEAISKPAPVADPAGAPAPEPRINSAIPAAETAAEPSPQPLTVIPPQQDANPLNTPKPVYPALSRRLREEGTVMLDVLILADGSVGEVRLKTSSGYKRLDDTAIQAVKRWRYQPARRGDENIDYWHLQPIEFSLRY